MDMDQLISSNDVELRKLMPHFDDKLSTTQMEHILTNVFQVHSDRASRNAPTLIESGIESLGDLRRASTNKRLENLGVVIGDVDRIGEMFNELARQTMAGWTTPQATGDLCKINASGTHIQVPESTLKVIPYFALTIQHSPNTKEFFLQTKAEVVYMILDYVNHRKLPFYAGAGLRESFITLANFLGLESENGCTCLHSSTFDCSIESHRKNSLEAYSFNKEYERLIKSSLGISSSNTDAVLARIQEQQIDLAHQISRFSGLEPPTEVSSEENRRLSSSSSHSGTSSECLSESFRGDSELVVLVESLQKENFKLRLELNKTQLLLMSVTDMMQTTYHD